MEGKQKQIKYNEGKSKESERKLKKQNGTSKENEDKLKNKHYKNFENVEREYMIVFLTRWIKEHRVK